MRYYGTDASYDKPDSCDGLIARDDPCTSTDEKFIHIWKS